jgi:hypothetical protein
MSCWFFKSLLPLDTYLKHFLLKFQADKTSTAAISLNAIHDIKNSSHVFQNTQFWSINDNFLSLDFSTFGSISSSGTGFVVVHQACSQQRCPFSWSWAWWPWWEATRLVKVAGEDQRTIFGKETKEECSAAVWLSGCWWPRIYRRGHKTSLHGERFLLWGIAGNAR